MKKYVMQFLVVLALALLVSSLTACLIKDDSRREKHWDAYGWPVSFFKKGGFLEARLFDVEASRFAANTAIWLVIVGGLWIGCEILRSRLR